MGGRGVVHGKGRRMSGQDERTRRSWAFVRSELEKVTRQRDALAAQLIQVQEVLRDQRNYGRDELIEELEGIVS